MSKDVKVTRTITNLYVVGKTTYSGSIATIEKPYEIIQGLEGIQMIPMDQHLLGKELDYITIKNDNVIYSEQPGEALRNLYLETISGIEVPKPEIIV